MHQTTATHRNCSALCAEMLGGNCPGQHCAYRPLKHLGADFDPRLAEAAAEARGQRLERRSTRIQQRQNITFGFWLGVITVLAALLVLAIAQWVAT